MCGLFGFAGAQLDMGVLKVAARLARTRGPHAWGVAWQTDDGVMNVYRASGPLDERALDRCAGARLLIGCCRLATSGDWHEERNNQPLVAGDVALVHNGTVGNAAALFAQYGYTPQTANDSEGLLAVLTRAFGTLEERCAAALIAHEPRTPLAALVLSEGRVLALRDRHPLTLTCAEGGEYLCSRRLDVGWSCIDLPERAGMFSVWTKEREGFEDA